jgi:hypothetical protein
MGFKALDLLYKKLYISFVHRTKEIFQEKNFKLAGLLSFDSVFFFFGDN